MDQPLVDDDGIPPAPPNLWLAVYLLIIPPAVIWLFPFEAIAIPAGIVWVMGSLPLAIMIAIDWYRHPAAHTGVVAVVHGTFRGLIFLLGTTAVVFGLVVLLWLVHSVFSERSPLGVPFGLAGAVVMYSLMIGVGLKFIRLSLPRTRTSGRPSWTGPSS